MWRPLINAGILGALFGSYALFSEFHNNNQGEYYDVGTGTVDVWYAVTMFLFFTCSVALFVVVVEVAILHSIRFLERHSRSLRRSSSANAFEDQIFALPLIDAVVLGLIALAVSSQWYVVAATVFVVEVAVCLGRNRIPATRAE